MIGRLNNRVKFFELRKSGPEVGSMNYVKVYECFANDYDPTIKDQAVLGVTAGKKTVTVKIRNNIKGFQPQYHHVFELENGYFKGEKFNIKSVAPDRSEPQYLKILGEGIGG